MYILGISAYYHDSAAALMQDGMVLFAIQQERLTRIKHDKSFPDEAINKCLEYASLNIPDIDCIIYYEKPFLKFERILDTITSGIPYSFSHFFNAVPLWVKKRLWISSEIRNKLNYKGEILFAAHHDSHAAAAYYNSGFIDAAIVTLDGVGEYSTGSVATGTNNKIETLREQHFPHSLGLLYSSFTQYCGFRVNSGEYKVMGLAPYGKPLYKQIIYDHLIKVFPDGSYRMNMKYFKYAENMSMINKYFETLFGRPVRKPETEIDTFYMDIASSIQEVIEEVVLRILKFTKELTKSKNVVLGGGVILNCKLNQKITEAGLFENHYFYSCPGDAGSAIGAAYLAWHHHYDKPYAGIKQNEVYLGSHIYYDNQSEIENQLMEWKVPYQINNNVYQTIAKEIAEGKIVAWFNGRMEFGPRALGNRSILASPEKSEMKSVLNEKIKLRENFRPFAPAILAEKADEYFHLHKTNYNTMMVTATARPGTEKIMPAVIHADNTARIQTVSESDNPQFYKLLKAFYIETGCPALINTSFNVRGEPIAATLKDALHTFLYTDIDLLVVDARIIISKNSNLDLSKSLIPEIKYAND